MVNKVILVGRLGKDPEVRRISNNTAVANFPLATNEVYKNQEGGYTEQTEWHNIVMWRGVAERAEKILRKGASIFVEGKLRTRSWDDKDGNKRYTTEVVVDNFQLLDKKNDSTSGGGNYSDHKAEQPSTSSAPEATSSEPTFEDDLPF